MKYFIICLLAFFISDVTLLNNKYYSNKFKINIHHKQSNDISGTFNGGHHHVFHDHLPGYQKNTHVLHNPSDFEVKKSNDYKTILRTSLNKNNRVSPQRKANYYPLPSSYNNYQRHTHRHVPSTNQGCNNNCKTSQGNTGISIHLPLNGPRQNGPSANISLYKKRRPYEVNIIETSNLPTMTPNADTNLINNSTTKTDTNPIFRGVYNKPNTNIHTDLAGIRSYPGNPFGDSIPKMDNYPVFRNFRPNTNTHSALPVTWFYPEDSSDNSDGILAKTLFHKIPVEHKTFSETNYNNKNDDEHKIASAHVASALPGSWFYPDESSDDSDEIWKKIQVPKIPVEHKTFSQANYNDYNDKKEVNEDEHKVAAVHIPSVLPGTWFYPEDSFDNSDKILETTLFPKIPAEHKTFSQADYNNKKEVIEDEHKIVVTRIYSVLPLNWVYHEASDRTWEKIPVPKIPVELETISQANYNDKKEISEDEHKIVATHIPSALPWFDPEDSSEVSKAQNKVVVTTSQPNIKHFETESKSNDENEIVLTTPQPVDQKYYVYDRVKHTAQPTYNKPEFDDGNKIIDPTTQTNENDLTETVDKGGYRTRDDIEPKDADDVAFEPTFLPVDSKPEVEPTTQPNDNKQNQDGHEFDQSNLQPKDKKSDEENKILAFTRQPDYIPVTHNNRNVDENKIVTSTINPNNNRFNHDLGEEKNSSSQEDDYETTEDDFDYLEPPEAV